MRLGGRGEAAPLSLIVRSLDDKVNASSAPNCLVMFHDQEHRYPIEMNIDGAWFVVAQKCPSCDRVVVHLASRGWYWRLVRQCLLRFHLVIADQLVDQPRG